MEGTLNICHTLNIFFIFITAENILYNSKVNKSFISQINKINSLNELICFHEQIHVPNCVVLCLVFNILYLRNIYCRNIHVHICVCVCVCEITWPYVSTISFLLRHKVSTIFVKITGNLSLTVA